MRSFEIRVLGNDIKVTTTETHDGEIVSWGEYRKRNTRAQVAHEQRLWQDRGYTQVASNNYID